MTTTDLDALLDWTPEEIEQEQARANRPTFRKEPVIFEGEWNGEVRHVQSEPINGTSYPRLGLPFTRCHFVDVGHGVGLYTEGGDYVLQLEIPPATTKKGQPFPRHLTQAYRNAKASGHELKWFAGSRIRVTEMSGPSGRTNDKGYDIPNYWYRFEKIGEPVSAGAAIPDELVTAALTFIAGNQFTRANVGMALMKNPDCNSNAVLNGKFADGSWLKEMLDAGRIKEVDGGILTT